MKKILIVIIIAFYSCIKFDNTPTTFLKIEMKNQIDLHGIFGPETFATIVVLKSFQIHCTSSVFHNDAFRFSFSVAAVFWVQSVQAGKHLAGCHMYSKRGSCQGSDFNESLALSLNKNTLQSHRVKYFRS